ncbi:unnamed protein product [Caenorhabditis sp. 36 PRJEB53466]|nr:unnamed protein product [Caenorhabditis sp. 36 PRJEB53466]
MKKDTIIRVDGFSFRKNAGFETAAGPDEPLLFVPQKYWLLGLSTYCMLFTIIAFSTGRIFYAGILFFFPPIFFALMIFVPNIFAHHIHYRLQFTRWIVVSFGLIIWFLYAVISLKSSKAEEECGKGPGKAYDECKASWDVFFNWLYAWQWLCEPAAIMCTFILYRLWAITGDSL